MTPAPVYSGRPHTIITGHSTVMKPADLAEYSRYVGAFVEAVRAGKKAGQTVDQIAAAGRHRSHSRACRDTAPAAERLAASTESPAAAGCHH